jgi:ribosome-associated toxin RatA of RatAB toxin-antitoxin module
MKNIFKLCLILLSFNTWSNVNMKIKLLDNNVYQIDASIQISASKKKVWSILTDYSNFPKYFPFVKKCNVETLSKNEKLIEQVVESGILFFTKQLTVKIKSTEDYLNKIIIENANDTFKVYQGYWKLEQSQSGTLLIYHLQMSPNFFAPSFALKYFNERDIPETLRIIKKWSLKN